MLEVNRDHSFFRSYEGIYYFILNIIHNDKLFMRSFCIKVKPKTYALQRVEFNYAIDLDQKHDGE